MISGKLKLLLWAVVLFAVWRIMLNDTLSNAILGFFFSGQVPGSDTVLSPGVMFASVCTFALCALVFLLYRAWRRHRLVRHFLRHGADEPTKAVATQATSKVVQKTSKSRTKKEPVSKPAPLASSWAHKAATRLRHIGARLYRTVRRVAHVVGMYALGCYELVRIGIMKGARLVRRGALRVWRWLLPYGVVAARFLRKWLLQAAAWVRAHLNKTEVWGLAKDVARETAAILRAIPWSKPWRFTQKYVQKGRIFLKHFLAKKS